MAARVLVDSGDAADVAAVNALQDRFELAAASAMTFEPGDFDAPASTPRARRSSISRKHVGGFDHAFGAKDDVDPLHHLLGTAAGGGGLPDREAFYISVEPGQPVGAYELTVTDVPVDGFWSISLYNAEGFFEPNDRNAYSVNNLTAVPNDDGSVTVRFGGLHDRPNCLPIMEGWNYTVRLYRPRPEVLDGSWKFPTIAPDAGVSP